MQGITQKSFYPWLAWFLGASFYFYKYLLQLSPGVMTPDLMRAFHVTGAGLGNLAACFFYVYLFMQIPVGMILDRYNPQKIISAAILICVGAVLGFAHTRSLAVAEFFRATLGFGAAFACISCLKIASVWFPPQRLALVTGISLTVAMLGAVNGCAPLAYLVSNFGWRGALTSLAIPGLVLAILVFMIVRDKPEARITHHYPSTHFFSGLFQVLKNKQTWALSFYSGFAYAPFSVLGGLWGVPFIQASHHLTRTDAAAKVSWMFVGFAMGAPILGYISDAINRRRLIILWGTLVELLAIFVIIYYPTLPPFWVSILMFLMGVGTSGFLMCFCMVQEINSVLLAATAIGFMNAFDSLWEALSEPFIGRLLDLGWTGQMENGARIFSIHDYQSALVILPIYLLCALVVVMFIKESRR